MDFFYIPIIIAIGFLFIDLFKNQLTKKELGNLKKLWIFHLVMSVTYYFFTRNGGGDAWRYWYIAKDMNSSDFWFNLFESQGTYFLFALNYIPAKVLQMGFLSNTLLFGLLGFIGLTFFYAVAVKVIPFNVKYKNFLLFPTVFFLPNLHFWSGGIGKDSLLLFCVGLFVYSLLNFPKRIVLSTISLFLAYLLRPHIALFLLLAFGLAYLLDSKVKTFYRIFLTVVLLAGAILVLPSVMEYANIEDASLEGFENFSENKTALLSREKTDSALASSSSLPVKMFAFLYRPFFFDINGLPAVVASFENFLLLLLSIKVFMNKPVKTFRKAPLIVKGLMIFLLIGTVAFSMTLGNVGIMIRMRNMVLPGMLIYFLWSFSFIQQLSVKRKKEIKYLKSKESWQ